MNDNGNISSDPTATWINENLTSSFLKEVRKYLSLKIKGKNIRSFDLDEAINDFVLNALSRGKFNCRLNKEGEAIKGKAITASRFGLFVYFHQLNGWVSLSTDAAFRAVWCNNSTEIEEGGLPSTVTAKVRPAATHPSPMGMQTRSEMSYINGRRVDAKYLQGEAEYHNPDAPNPMTILQEKEDKAEAKGFSQYGEQAMLRGLSLMVGDTTKRGKPFKGASATVENIYRGESVDDLQKILGTTKGDARKKKARINELKPLLRSYHQDGLRILRRLRHGVAIPPSANPKLVQHMINGALICEDSNGVITITDKGIKFSKLPRIPLRWEDCLFLAWCK